MDGVLTDGSIFIGGEREFKRFNIRDGLGIVLARRAGLKVGWVSARPSLATKLRADELKIDFLVQQTDRTSKTGAIEALLAQERLSWNDVCFVGDDIVDLGPLQRAGLAVAVADGVTEAKGGSTAGDAGGRRTGRDPRGDRNDFTSAGKMGDVCGALFGMKNKLNIGLLILPLLAALGFCAVRAQQATTGRANDFTSVEYFEPPHQMLIKTRLTGAEARPLAGGKLLAITQLKLETFDSNGVPGMIVKAPHCIYDSAKGVANSPGHLRLESADGNSYVEGDGFLWLQPSEKLYISNNVNSVFETASKGKAGL